MKSCLTCKVFPKQAYNGRMSEDEKTQITSCIDCNILSPPLLMHAVQNPRMPLRFIVQAMLIEQLTTHRSLFSVLNTAHHHHRDSPVSTLGAILERDAALRQVTQLRSAIDTTCSRIKTLEKELCGMKKLLLESERGPSILLDHQKRSSSCRFNSNSNSNRKVERGQRGSISSSFLRFVGGDGGSGSGGSNGGSGGSNELVDDMMKMGNSNTNNYCDVGKKNFGQRLIRGLRNVFGVSNNRNDSKDKDNNGRFDNGRITRRGVVMDENHHSLSR